MDSSLVEGYAEDVFNYLGYLRGAGDTWYYWVGLVALSLSVLALTYYMSKDKNEGYTQGGVFATLIFILGSVVASDSETSRALIAITKQQDLEKLKSEQVTLVEGYLQDGIETAKFRTLGTLGEGVVIPKDATNNLVTLTFDFEDEFLENKVVYVVSTDNYKDRELIEFDLTELKKDLQNEYNTLVSAKDNYRDALWDVNGFKVVSDKDTTADEVLYILNIN